MTLIHQVQKTDNFVNKLSTGNGIIILLSPLFIVQAIHGIQKNLLYIIQKYL